MNITDVWVYGERNTGTKWVKNMVNQVFEGVQCIAGLPWKHDHLYEIRLGLWLQHTLVLFVTRDAYDWAVAMHSKPHHSQVAIKHFRDFIHHEWRSFSEDYEEAELVWDRNHSSCEPYESVFSLRLGKLQSWLDMRHVFPHHLHVRYEDLLVDGGQQAFYELLAQQFNLRRRKSVVSPKSLEVNHKLADYSQYRLYFRSYNVQDLNFSNSILRSDVEEQFGYRLVTALPKRV